MQVSGIQAGGSPRCNISSSAALPDYEAPSFQALDRSSCISCPWTEGLNIPITASSSACAHARCSTAFRTGFTACALGKVQLRHHEQTLNRLRGRKLLWHRLWSKAFTSIRILRIDKLNLKPWGLILEQRQNATSLVEILKRFSAMFIAAHCYASVLQLGFIGCWAGTDGLVLKCAYTALLFIEKIHSKWILSIYQAKKASCCRCKLAFQSFYSACFNSFTRIMNSFVLDMSTSNSALLMSTCGGPNPAWGCHAILMF